MLNGMYDLINNNNNNKNTKQEYFLMRINKF